MKKIAAAIVSLMMALTAGACSNNPFGDRWADAEKAVLAADPSIARVSASSSTDGFALEWSIAVWTTGDTITAQQLRSIIEICMDHLTRENEVTLFALTDDGERIDLRPAYTELGFDIGAHTEYTEATRKSGDPSDFKDLDFSFSNVYIEDVLGT